VSLLICCLLMRPSNHIDTFMHTMTTDTSNEDENAILLKRLQAQFGDMDLSNLMQSENNNDNDYDSDESSSLIEPTPEELLEWQQQQFQKGKEKLNAKKKTEPPNDWEEIYLPPKFLVDNSNSSLLTQQNVTTIFQLCTKHKQKHLCNEWKCLYTSTIHGFSYFHYTLKDYNQPTVIVLQTTTGSKLGIFTSTQYYSTKNEMYGNHYDCFLFTIDDDIKILNAKSINVNGNDAATATTNDKGKPYLYCDKEDGIRIGGTISQPRIHLTKTLERCRALPFCTKFDDGDLLLPSGGDTSLYYFDVTQIEVYGVGSSIDDAIQHQQKQRAIHESTMLQRRKIYDKTQLLGDVQLMQGHNDTMFSHISAAAGRMDV